eukprot:TRINITY_DN6737_c0_g2_i3.p1 TRINITY_DN6737_c0_g2~~TRINITY_DN6737_c0_g2_i3.p1  ORF type:complete len:488 (+),score=117.71 TRINITY_DN6737_c0_g2_i3:245-1708(+)
MPLAPKFAMMICSQVLPILESEPNINKIGAPGPNGHKIIVVGDLHGSLGDLQKIIMDNGPPSQELVYVFNGDFVDRGRHGVEVLLVLLAMKILHPQYIYLDRGNHEDQAITTSYGFKEETKEKYDEQMYKIFIKVFKRIPLCSVVGEETGDGVFIVHGGLFADETVGLKDILTIKRKKYASTLTRRKGRVQSRTDRMLEDMMWSDPWDKPGVTPSDRGSGILFGVDVVESFLRANNLKTLIRSHECIEEGAEYHRVPGNMHLYTVFSSSNYTGGNNFAAILILEDLKSKPKIVRFRSTLPPPRAQMQSSNAVRLQDLICRRHFRLLRTFQESDPSRTGAVSPDTWCSIMAGTLKMPEIAWEPMMAALVGEKARDKDRNILYATFLKRHSMKNYGSKKLEFDDSNTAVTSLYANYDMLKAVFRQWDTNNDGSVDLEEFCAAMTILKEVHGNSSPELQIDPNELFEQIDLDGSGVINLNELCEASRLAA